MFAVALAATPPLACASPNILGAVPPSGSVEVYQARIVQEGERNRVLNDMETGARAFWAGNYDLSKSSFDDAIPLIERVFANDPDALKARSVWYDEGSKIFKGEPYERVMVYFYRGLLYLRDGDYENARAAFRAGQLQDAFAEEGQYQCDFAVMMFLEAWASHLNHDADLRDEALERLKRVRPNFPGIGAHDDTIVIAETGASPRKLADGPEHAFFVYRPGKGFTENHAELVRPGGPVPLFPMEDIFFQASTRGGRAIDKILNGKVQFVEGSQAVSGTMLPAANIVLTVSEVSTGRFSGGATIAGGALAGVGAIATLMAANARPTADTRTWTSLPDKVHVMTFSSREAPTEGLAVRFLDPGGEAAMPDKPLVISHDPHGALYGWARSR